MHKEEDDRVQMGQRILTAAAYNAEEVGNRTQQCSPVWDDQGTQMQNISLFLVSPIHCWSDNLLDEINGCAVGVWREAVAGKRVVQKLCAVWLHLSIS